MALAAVGLACGQVNMYGVHSASDNNKPLQIADAIVVGARSVKVISGLHRRISDMTDRKKNRI
jgi:hypothetical protein